MLFVDLGLVLEPASCAAIRALRRLAAGGARWLLLAESFGAREALRCGHRQPRRARRQPRRASSADVVQRLLAKPAEGLQLTQELLRHGTDEEILERMELEGVHFNERLQSREVKEVIAAFFAARAQPRLGREVDGLRSGHRHRSGRRRR